MNNFHSFKDNNNNYCSLQKSDLEDCILLGRTDVVPIIMNSEREWVDYILPLEVCINSKMHLSRCNVFKILPKLIKFVITGEV